MSERGRTKKGAAQREKASAKKNNNKSLKLLRALKLIVNSRPFLMAEEICQKVKWLAQIEI